MPKKSEIVGAIFISKIYFANIYNNERRLQVKCNNSAVVVDNVWKCDFRSLESACLFDTF